MTMTNDERLLSYIESAKAAISDVTDGAIGHGDDPLSFVICCFRSQADKIKELLGTIENEACRFNCRTQKDNEKKIKQLQDATMDELTYPDFSDLMTMEDWVSTVECGGITDYDGYGYYSDGEKEFRHINVYPSMLSSGKLDRSWSHIIWFNK